jgi:hypothetical protein
VSDRSKKLGFTSNSKVRFFICFLAATTLATLAILQTITSLGFIVGIELSVLHLPVALVLGIGAAGIVGLAVLGAASAQAQEAKQEEDLQKQLVPLLLEQGQNTLQMPWLREGSALANISL